MNVGRAQKVTSVAPPGNDRTRSNASGVCRTQRTVVAKTTPATMKADAAMYRRAARCEVNGPPHPICRGDATDDAGVLDGSPSPINAQCLARAASARAEGASGVASRSALWRVVVGSTQAAKWSRADHFGARVGQRSLRLESEDRVRVRKRQSLNSLARRLSSGFAGVQAARSR